MKNTFAGDLNEFHSALQLSINSEVITVLRNQEVCSLSFSKKPDQDERWVYFERLTDGEWKVSEKKDVFLYQFPEGLFDLQDLTQFLFLTRLEKENMLKLASLDVRYKKYVIKIFGVAGIIQGRECFENFDQVVSFIFSEIEKRKMTIRELAHQTGLSMVSISNFKAGKDIRLSNFLKILSVLGIKMKLE